MKTRLGAILFAGALLATAAVPLAAEAGRRTGRANAPCVQTQTRDCTQTRQRLRDGSCNPDCPKARSGNRNQGGNTYGPGDGTGNQASGPRDGTGFGAPAQR